MRHLRDIKDRLDRFLTDNSGSLIIISTVIFVALMLYMTWLELIKLVGLLI